MCYNLNSKQVFVDMRYNHLSQHVQDGLAGCHQLLLHYMLRLPSQTVPDVVQGCRQLHSLTQPVKNLHVGTPLRNPLQQTTAGAPLWGRAFASQLCAQVCIIFRPLATKTAEPINMKLITACMTDEDQVYEQPQCHISSTKPKERW